uniref:ladderlectin-like isoform X1 n=1 Tax=Epinephelus lanceolatus TaxID=310571 RepID=UPI001445F859|nr:ladderlectin-like isoform X1 [Epinephelus lanceolatus]
MKMLTVSALVCAMVVLTRAAAPPEETPQSGQKESHLVKRWIVVRRVCPWGWSLLGGRCYRYIPTLMTWARAERYCQALGGNLASVHNYRQYYWMQRLILSATHSYRQAWIGGSDAQQEHYWLWSDGTSFNYRRWCSGEPNNHGGNQHCLQMNHAAGRCWDDRQCFHRLPSVCARKRR